MITNILEGLRNIFYWFRVIWQDRDWDTSYLFKILKHKLASMEKFQRDNGHWEGSNDVADEIQACVFLLNRLIDDEYLEESLQPVEEKWGKSEIFFYPLKDNQPFFSMGVKFLRDLTPDEIAQAESEQKIAYEKSARQPQIDWDTVCEIMRSSAFGWWD